MVETFPDSSPITSAAVPTLVAAAGKRASIRFLESARLLIPVPQFDYLAEVRALVPSGKLKGLRDFWHMHNDGINDWVHVPAATQAGRARG